MKREAALGGAGVSLYARELARPGQEATLANCASHSGSTTPISAQVIATCDLLHRRNADGKRREV
jgi:hypothetical protein